MCHVRCPKMLFSQFSANGKTWVPCLWTCHTPWSSKLFETHLSRAKIVCLCLPTWVTCIVPAGLFAAWPPRLKLLKKRSKCLHPRTLDFQAMIQIQLSCIHLAILCYFTVPRPGQGDARWSVEIWCRKCSRSFERPRQTLAEKRGATKKKTLFWLTSKDTKPMQVN